MVRELRVRTYDPTIDFKVTGRFCRRDFPLWEIDEDFNVYNKSGRKLTWVSNTKGDSYFYIFYHVGDGSRKKIYKHRLIITTVLYKPDLSLVVNHIDHVKSNNSIDNLELCTSKHNNREAIRIGVNKNIVGSNHHNAKLDEEKVYTIKRSSKSVKELAKEYGVSEATVKNILTGRTWRHVL